MKKTLALIAAVVMSACSSGGDDDGTPNYPNPGEPNDSIGTATQMTPGIPVVATISTEADYDFYKFTVPSGGATVNFQTFDSGGTSCDLGGNSVDPVVAVYAATDLTYPEAQSDDSGINWCEDFNVTLPAGTNYVVVRAYPGVPLPMIYTLKVNIL